MHLSDVSFVVPELPKKVYEERLADLQLELLKLQMKYHHQRRRGLILFEGWDAAGKGGAIRRLTEKLDPRGCEVHAFGPPTSYEKDRHYLFRFWTKLPPPGKIVIFDRTWYGRVLVERIEKFATRTEWMRAYQEINEFERWLTDDGLAVIKIFLHISQAEQLVRFKERESDPYKHWKITDDDWRNRKKWRSYETAYNDMFDRTHTGYAPWHVIAGNDKQHARITVLETALVGLSR